MSFGTVAVLLILAVIVILDIRYLYNGGGSECASCGSASSCGGTKSSSCKWAKDIKKAQRRIAAEKRRTLNKS
ncbi:MAG: hypothetical protein K6D03_02465 [Solobacterium sp.]|nr:hypothetical protein [Solobacterium sp.]